MLDNTELSAGHLRKVFGQFATGVCVVSVCDDDGNPTGVTVNSFTSLSMEPALCLFSLGKDQVSARWFGKDTPYVINVLEAAQEDVAWNFARFKEDKFEGIDTEPAAMINVPVIRHALAHFECRIWDVYDGGDHFIFVGQILAAVQNDGDPLVFHGGKMKELSV